MRQKPDFVGPDGGNDTFLGFTHRRRHGNHRQQHGSSVREQCQLSEFLRYFGCDAARGQHRRTDAAGGSCADADADLFDTCSKAPRRWAQRQIQPSGPTILRPAMDSFRLTLLHKWFPRSLPAAPTLSLAASSIVTGSSTTLTWSSVNTTGCTASGSWSGPMASDGTMTVNPTAVGSDTYTLVCANAAGTSAGNVRHADGECRRDPAAAELRRRRRGARAFGPARSARAVRCARAAVAAQPVQLRRS